MTRGRLNGAGIAALSLALASLGLPAAPTDSVTGNLDSTAKDGGGHYTCYGTPTCVGVATVTTVHHNNNCTNNTFTFSSNITFTGLDLSHTGTITGTFTIAQVQSGQTTNQDGSCTYQLVPGSTWPFTATWDGKQGQMTIASVDTNGTSNPFAGPFIASLASAPVFPMTVSANVTTTTSTVSAQVQPRPQDVGAAASIYVFAQAPSNLVIGAPPAKRAPAGATRPAKPEDDAIVCVLAQVNASGQFVAVSASTMQAYLMGVLTSQSQAVQILNNVPTPNVVGASLFVGYGESAAAMFSSNLYQTALSVPGGVQCTASLASAPAPTSPGALTGRWWNANESGWGIHFTQRGSNIFAAWYTYDAAGKPKWYVASACTGMTGTSGTCTGTLYEVNGPTFFGVPFTPITASQVSAAGMLQASFTDANNGSMTYTVGSVTRTVPITRQPVGVGTLTPAVDYSDLWWNPNESGWGIAMAQQNANIFLAWYVYDNTGKPVWYVASNCTVNGSSCSGVLYSTKGPAFGPTFPPNQIQVITAGSVIVSFVDANNAVLSYTVGNVTATKTITRQIF